ncbi:MAG: hypothetical protein RMJ53_09365, partial [Chitinophagales bacterium]|nr:hypothetical protein [Chitinophagales bacterium]MDW8274423.1 hypothetical protein [Chitinophagales bacterium]
GHTTLSRLLHVFINIVSTAIHGYFFSACTDQKEFGELLPDWIKIINVSDKAKQQLVELLLYKGEENVIALAIEKPEMP